MQLSPLLVAALIAAPLPLAAQDLPAAAQVARCGGTQARLALDDPTPERLKRAVDVIEERLGNSLPLPLYTEVAPAGGLVVWLPEPKRLPEGLFTQVDLGMHEVFEDAAGGADVPDGYRQVPDRFDPTRTWLIAEAPLLTESDLAEAAPIFDMNGGPAISFRFTDRGAALFAEFTSDNVGNAFAIVIDGEVISAPRIMTPITRGQGMISGAFTVEEATELALALDAGAMPDGLTLTELTAIAPAEGADTSGCP